MQTSRDELHLVCYSPKRARSRLFRLLSNHLIRICTLQGCQTGPCYAARSGSKFIKEPLYVCQSTQYLKKGNFIGQKTKKFLYSCRFQRDILSSCAQLNHHYLSGCLRVCDEVWLVTELKFKDIYQNFDPGCLSFFTTLLLGRSRVGTPFQDVFFDIDSAISQCGTTIEQHYSRRK